MGSIKMAPLRCQNQVGVKIAPLSIKMAPLAPKTVAQPLYVHNVHKKQSIKMAPLRCQNQVGVKIAPLSIKMAPLAPKTVAQPLYVQKKQRCQNQVAEVSKSGRRQNSPTEHQNGPPCTKNCCAASICSKKTEASKS